MTTVTDLYQINGKPLPVPDQDVEMSFEDLDAGDAGRDEAGYMHRHVVRRRVGAWNFIYSFLDQQTYTYLLGILPNGSTFTFTYPDPADPTRRRSTEAYLSGYGIVWRCARTGQYRNLKFSVIEC